VLTAAKDFEHEVQLGRSLHQQGRPLPSQPHPYAFFARSVQKVIDENPREISLDEIPGCDSGTEFRILRKSGQVSMSSPSSNRPPDRIGARPEVVETQATERDGITRDHENGWCIVREAPARAPSTPVARTPGRLTVAQSSILWGKTHALIVE